MKKELQRAILKLFRDMLKMEATILPHAALKSNASDIINRLEMIKEDLMTLSDSIETDN